MKNIIVEQYQERNLPIFKKYIQRAFHEKYILSDSNYIDWQFDKLYIVKAGEEIVGHFGFKDINYKIYGASQSSRVLVNLYVLPQFRGFGIGTLLAKKVFDTPKPIFVFGYSDAMFKLGSHLRTTWRAGGNLNRFIAILNADTPLLISYRIPKTIHKLGFGSDITVEKINSMNSLFEEFWENIRERYAVTVERTLRYLTWRYINHPFFNYVFFAAKESQELKGYLICRCEEDKGFKIARIIDVIATDKAERPLIEKFLWWARAEKAFLADFMFSGDFYHKTLQDAGFFDVLGTDFIHFPVLFSPISYQKLFINVAYDSKLQFDDCYFTKADGDQDRPNPH